jgi:hypothetical protein
MKLSVFFLAAALAFSQNHADKGKGHGGGNPPPPPPSPGPLACTDLENSVPITGPISMSPLDWCVINGATSTGALSGVATPTANGWSFNFPLAPYMLQRVVSPVATSFTQSQSLSITFTLTTNNAVFQIAPDATACPPTTADMTLYFEHAANTQDVQDWRWWSGPEIYIISSSTNPLTEKITVTLTVPLQPSKWSDANGVNGANDTAGFSATLADVGVVGFEIGSGCFFGHGTLLESGTASMEVTAFDVQ